MITDRMISKIYDRIDFHGHGPEGIAEGLEQVFRENLGEILAAAPDLDAVRAALSREYVIRQVVAESGEDRRTVADMRDAMESMGQEAVLELTDGEPTTLRDAVQRYVETLEEGDGRSSDPVELGPYAMSVVESLTTILAYPFPGPAVVVLENASRAVHREVTTRLGSA